MNNQVNCKWTGDMVFESDINGFNLVMDASPEFGGQNKGMRPKPLTLASLGGCTGMDVVSMLQKMHMNLTYFNILVDGELTEDHPKYYHKIHLTYEFKGENLDLKKIKQAIDLSQDKYCGVGALLKKGAEVTYDIKILD